MPHCVSAIIKQQTKISKHSGRPYLEQTTNLNNPYIRNNQLENLFQARHIFGISKNIFGNFSKIKCV